MKQTSLDYELLPLPGDQVAFLAGGVEKLRWHGGIEAPRPFFFPFCGPSNVSLTRMGHPGAPNHDHHRSVWFAHHKVQGIDFWSDNTTARIEQTEWLCYQHEEEAAIFATRLAWRDGHNPEPLMTQDLIAGFSLDEQGGTLLELQSIFTPTSETLELLQTNFGFLAVRVAQSISTHFGSGVITDSEGRTGEKDIFGNPARWMDYSGPILTGTGEDRREETEGVTYYDHPDNPSYPSRWHVRADGWMGASLNRTQPIMLKKSAPLVVRYLLNGHAGGANAERQNRLAADFAKASRWVLKKSTQANQYWEVSRSPAS